MPNKVLFNSARAAVPKTDARNDAGGRAYKLTPKQSLAQMAMTGCFNGTFYASAKTQLERVIALLPKVGAEYLAKLAVAARTQGFMKDMPAFILTYLAMKYRDDKGKKLLKAIFPLIVDNGKMLRNVVTFVRSGTFESKRTFPQPLRKELAKWFDRDPAAVFRATVGNDPSMRDILRMLHVRPATPLHEALFAYIVGKKPKGPLPEIVQAFEAFKDDPAKADVPKVDFRMLTGIEIPDSVWVQIAKDAKWMMTRMNLNTFQRHGVFKDSSMVTMIAKRLKDAEQIRRARAFPYQLLAAYRAVESSDMPRKIVDALHDAMEIATDNVPEIDGDIAIGLDTSGSMHGAAITGHRGSATSAVRCVDVAALFASAVLRKNRSAKVLPFDTSIRRCKIEPRDTVMTNANKLAKLGGGGTNCSLPLRALNQSQTKVDAVIFVSDYESWVDSDSAWDYGDRTGMMSEWTALKRRCPKAKLVCIDLTPRDNAQVRPRKDILQVGGFSDQVFNVVADFLASADDDAWVQRIEAIDLKTPDVTKDEEIAEETKTE
jgi:60 kDa SS-A/Ro ribonucleoprotein